MTYLKGAQILQCILPSDLCNKSNKTAFKVNS